MSRVSTRGYLGITARNTESIITDVEVEAIKIVNNDPNAVAYKNLASTQSDRAEKAPSKFAYTDALEE